MIELLKKIYPLRLAPVSPDTDKAIKILQKELPFAVHEYPSGMEFNGWMVPEVWVVEKALIQKDGKLIYDGTKHPLGVMSYGKSFKGRVAIEELKKHLTYRKDFPKAVGYHCDYYYKPWRADWGFSIPYEIYEKLGSGNYDIDLKVNVSKGKMKVCDYFLQGETDDTFFLNAHNCHAGQANDDIAGVVVGIEIMKRLAKQKNHYSYRLIIAPEHLGTVFYLAGLSKNEIKKFKCGFFLEMLGNKNRLALQETFTGKGLLDEAAHHFLKFRRPDYFSAPFRKVVGNDETVWEAPGYEIPTVSLSRWPYPEYHTSNDNESIISESMLEDSVGAVLGILQIMETNCTLKRKFDGLIALSNPKYDLYMSQRDPSIRPTISEEQVKWNYLMDCLPRYFDGTMTILEIARKHDLPYDELYEYIGRFQKKGLVSFVKRIAKSPVKVKKNGLRRTLRGRLFA